MKAFHLLGLICISVVGNAQSVLDTIKVIHDNNGYLKCLANVEFRASFTRSELTNIFTNDKRVEYSVKSRIFTIMDNNNLDGSGAYLQLSLDSHGPVVSFRGNTKKLDTIYDTTSIRAKDTLLGNSIGSIIFITRFQEGNLSEITFGIRTGQVFQIGVFKNSKNQLYEYYEIKCNNSLNDSGFLLRYSSRYSYDTPFALAIQSQTSSCIIFMYSKWNWKKFQRLTVRRHKGDDLSQDIYPIYYKKNGKVKTTSQKIIVDGSCE